MGKGQEKKASLGSRIVYNHSQPKRYFVRVTNGILFWLVILSGLLLLSFGSVNAQPLFNPTQDPMAGSQVFGEKGCTQCHGVNRIGAKLGPDLGQIVKPRTLHGFAAAMWNHLPQMAERMQQLRVRQPHLNPSEAGDLVAFLFTLNYFDRPGKARAGQRLFTNKKCVLCHQIGGVGGVVGPNLDSLRQYGTPIFVAAAMWNHGPAMAEAMRARGVTRPRFKGSELRDLIAYFSAGAPAVPQRPLHVLPGRPAEGEKLFAQKNCVECHGIPGRGGKVGPDLAKRELHRSVLEFAAAMWNKTPAMLEAMREKKIPVPPLQAGEMADLIAYLHAVDYFAAPGDPQRGKDLVTAKGCLVCHELGGVGGKAAPSFSRMAGLDAQATIIAGLWNHILLMDKSEKKGEVRWPRFSPEEMAILVTYLQFLGRKQS